MLFTEFDIDVAKKVWQEEAIENEKEKIAKLLLLSGDTVEKVSKITGLSMEIVLKLKS